MNRKLDASHIEAVQKTIDYMKNNLDKPMTLEELAQVASFSPFHFNRIFRKVTGLPPRQFLSALRLEEGKERLLQTDSSVTDITMDVGYHSFGTFTTRFTGAVGLPPFSFRKFSKNAITLLERFQSSQEEADSSLPVQNRVSGEIHAPDSFRGIIFVGLFPKRIPDRRPVCGTTLRNPGSYSLKNVPDGTYFVMAAAFSWGNKADAYLLPKNSLRGATADPIKVSGGTFGGESDLVLRPPEATDPPILISLPLLLEEMIKKAK